MAVDTPNTTNHSSLQPPSLIDVDVLLNLPDGDVDVQHTETNLPILVTSPSSTCTGVVVDIPPGKSVHSTYSFGLHDELGDPWNYSMTNGVLVLHAQNYKGKISTGHEQCPSCNTITKNLTLQGILDWMDGGVHKNSRLVYHGVGGLVKIIWQRTHQVEALHLQKLNDASKLVGKVTALESHKEWIMAIGSGKVECIDCLVHAGLAAKKGIWGMLELHNCTAQKVYHTQNYTEEDALQGLLLWCLWGSSCWNCSPIVKPPITQYTLPLDCLATNRSISRSTH